MSAVGPPRRQYFPKEFVPSENFVICGRGKKSYGHVGNQYFLQVVAGRINDYARADTKQEKSEIVQKIVREIDDKGGFIRQDDSTGLYYRAEDGAGREKTSQALRDCLKHKYKSSKDIKKTNRKAKRLARQASNKEMPSRRSSIGSTGTAHSGQQQHAAPNTATSSMPTTVQLPGFDPGALGQVRRQRHSIGNPMPVSSSSASSNGQGWDAQAISATLGFQIEPTPILNNNPQQQQQQQPSPMAAPSGGVNIMGATSNTNANVAMDPYAKPVRNQNLGTMNNNNNNNNMVNPWGSRSARGVVRRASASSYFDKSNATTGTTPTTGTGLIVGAQMDMLATKGTMVQNAALGYNDDDGMGAVLLGATAGADFQAQRRTSASSYGSSASSYWSGAESASSNYLSGTGSGAWVDNDDESWASGINFGLLTNDLEALRMAPGMEGFNNNNNNNNNNMVVVGGGTAPGSGGGVPMNIGVSPTATATNNPVIDLQQQLQQQQQQQQASFSQPQLQQQQPQQLQPQAIYANPQSGIPAGGAGFATTTNMDPIAGTGQQQQQQQIGLSAEYLATVGSGFPQNGATQLPSTQQQQQQQQLLSGSNHNSMGLLQQQQQQQLQLQQQQLQQQPGHQQQLHQPLPPQPQLVQPQQLLQQQQQQLASQRVQSFSPPGGGPQIFEC